MVTETGHDDSIKSHWQMPAFLLSVKPNGQGLILIRKTSINFQFDITLTDSVGGVFIIPCT